MKDTTSIILTAVMMAALVIGLAAVDTLMGKALIASSVIVLVAEYCANFMHEKE